MNFSATAFNNNFFPTIEQSGLTIYVAAYDTNSYPYSGTTWDDLQNNYNGTLENNPVFHSDNPRSFTFDGIDDYVTFGDSSSGSTTSDYTWGGWIKLSTTGDTDSFFGRSLDNQPTGNTGWSLVIYNSTGKASAAVIARTPPGSFVQSVVSGTTTLQTGIWYYIVGVWDNTGNSLKIFLNGIQEGNTTGITQTELRNTANVGLRGWFVGRGATTLDYYPADYSMFHMYNRALSSTEILNNFNTTKFYYGYN